MTVTLHRDLRTVPRRTGAGLPPDGAGFSIENALPVALPELGPLGDQWNRATLVDGQTGAGSAVPNERADCQFGAFPLGERRVVDWLERNPEPLPSTPLDRWQVMGPEIHGPNVSAFPQALVMIEVGPDKRRRLNANAGRNATRYRDLGPIVEDDVYSLRLDVFLTASAAGWVEVVRVNLRTGETWRARIDGPSIDQAIPGAYFKEALYRNAQINGRWVYDVSSMRVWDAEVDDELPPMLALDGGTPDPDPDTPPPPPAADTTPPRADLTPSNDGTWRATFPDKDVARIQVGIAGDPVPPQTVAGLAGQPEATGAWDRTKLTAGVQRWAWLIAWDAAGNQFTLPGGRPFTLVASTPPPPPPSTGPTQADLDAALARAAAAEGKLAAVRTDVAAETQRHTAAIAGALD